MFLLLLESLALPLCCYIQLQAGGPALNGRLGDQPVYSSVSPLQTNGLCGHGEHDAVEASKTVCTEQLSTRKRLEVSGSEAVPAASGQSLQLSGKVWVGWQPEKPVEAVSAWTGHELENHCAHPREHPEAEPLKCHVPLRRWELLPVRTGT